MKFNLHKNTLIGLALALGLVHQASAHEQAGLLSNTGGLAATGAGATDYYVVTCSNDPATGTLSDHLFFQIRDTSAGGNLVGMTVLKPGAPANAMAVTTVDPVGGTDAAYSQGQQINGGNGDYIVAVWHTGVAATENYSFTYHCEGAGGIHTGTSILRVSNQ